MNRKGFALIIFVALLAGGIWYYQSHKMISQISSVPSTNPITTSAKSSSTSLATTSSPISPVYTISTGTVVWKKGSFTYTIVGASTSPFFGEIECVAGLPCASPSNQITLLLQIKNNDSVSYATNEIPIYIELVTSGNGDLVTAATTTFNAITLNP
jgi:hypothetical protein